MTQQRGNAIGRQLGNYRLQRLLGTGGFADVYLGEHQHLGTLAAIKILHTKLTGEEVVHFQQEARLIARLSHPHIIRVFDFDVENMTPFLIMDYAPGGTLRQRHPKKTQVPLPFIITYVKQVAAGLQYAHDRKLVHRDIKPENMLIDQHGRIVISDFGVASIAHSTESQTVVEMAGTLPYIAPEQLQGLPRPASDQYALAVVIYEWISGERPFQGTLPEIVSQHIAKMPTRLHGSFPEVTSAVEDVIFKALSKDPRDRFATIYEFAQTLEQAYQGETTVVPLSSHSGSLGSSTVPEMQPAQAAHILSTPDVPYSTSNPTSTTMAASSRKNGQGPNPSGPFVSSGQLVPPAQKSSPRRSWMFIATIAVLFLLLLSGGAFYALQSYSFQFSESPAAPPTPTVNSQATAVQQAVVSTQTAVARTTATAQASTPQGLYTVVTSQPPSFSDSLASQSARAWDTNGSCVFSNGNYVISAPDGSFSPCIAQSTTNLCNLGYQVQMMALTGGGGGLIFRHAANEYRLRVSPDGSYDLVNNKDVITGGNSSSIQQGLNVTNQLTIIAQGNQINLYINSQYVTSVTDNTTSCGSIGLMAVVGKTAFSNVKVWSL